MIEIIEGNTTSSSNFIENVITVVLTQSDVLILPGCYDEYFWSDENPSKFEEEVLFVYIYF